MRYLRTNTDTRITVGPFLNKTDGITPEVALTVTSEKLTLVVDTGGVPTLVLDVAPTASAGANDMVHITGDDSGFYDLELAAANVNYLGRAMLSLNDVATHCPVFHEFTILPAQVYDSLILGTDLLDANASQVGGTSQTGRDIGASVLLSSGTGTGQLNIASGVVDANAVQVSGDATAADNAESFFDGTGYAGTNNVIPNVTLTATVTNLTNAPTAGDLTATMKTSVTTAATAATPTAAAVTGAVGSVAGNVVGSVGSLATQAKADVNAEVDAALVDIRLDELLAADSDIDGAAPPTVGSVFYELLSKTAGSFTFDQTTDSLEALRDRGDAAWVTATGFSTLDAAGVRTAVGLGSANLDTQLAAIDDLLDTEVAAIKSDTAAILIDTAEIGAAGAGLTALATQASVNTIDDFLDTEILAIKAKTDLIPAAPAAVGDIPTAVQNADAYLDRANGIETGVTPRQANRLILASSAGKLSGAATATVTIRNVIDTKDRITATVDADGNRSAVTVDAT